MKLLALVFSLFSLLLLTGALSAQDNIPRLRELDFSPFESALADFSAERAAEIYEIVLGATVADVQAAVSTGDLSYEELTLFFLDRIRRYDDAMRTFVELNPTALEDARAADELLAAGTLLGPLHGMPVSLKDNIQTVTPMHTTGGSEILLNYSPDADAPLVAQLRAGGAVILGKANLSELAGGVAMLPPGVSAVGGAVSNPHGPEFSPGGSSAGSGAGVSAYLTMLSVGSETAGSLVVPASWNGVVALYPGDGLVDGTGVIPLLSNNDSAGPVGRSVTDVATLLSVIDTADVDYTATLDANALQETTVGVFASLILARVELPSDIDYFADNEALLDKLAEALEGAGAEVVPAEWDMQNYQVVVQGLNFALNGGIRYDMIPYLVNAGAPIATLEDFQAYNLEAPETRIPYGQSTIENALADTAFANEAEFRDAVTDLKSRAAQLLDAAFAQADADVLVTFNNYESAVYATANYPAISVPLGLHENGLPVGAVFIGKPGGEAELLAYAYAFEQATHFIVTPELE